MNRSPARQAWIRMLFTLLAVSLVCWGSIAAVDWYQHDRPLREIESLLNSGQKSQALKLVGQFLRIYPEDARGQSLKARILVATGKHTEALRLFQRYGPADVDALRAWARMHLLREEWSDASSVLERILQLRPDDPDALFELTACRSFLGKYPEAFESAKRLASCPGNEARASLQIGTLHRTLGNTRSAIEAWERVLERDPELRQTQVQLATFLREFGRDLLADGKPERACEVLRQTVSLQETAEGLASLGEAQQQLGDTQGAVESWKRALANGGGLRLPRESLAQVALQEGKSDEARDWLEPLLSSPKLTSTTAYLMQRICLARKEWEAAQEWQSRTERLRKKEKRQSAIRRTLIDAPDSYWARAIRAFQFAEVGNWHEASAMTQTLQTEAAQEPFVAQLIECIQNHGPLPSLELVPIQQR